MNKDRLLELAEQCEAATGPDRLTDQAIGWVCGTQRWRGSQPDYDGPHYTASLDAAMSLVPSNCVWSAGDWKANGHCASASVWPPEKDRPEGFHGIAQASTPALALVAAALRALSTQQKVDGAGDPA